MDYILQFVIVIIAVIIYAVIHYYVYLDMKNNPEDKRKMYFWGEGSIWIIIGLYFCIELPITINSIGIIIWFFSSGICSLYFGFRLRNSITE